MEYNLSLEDMKWLRSHHKYGENGDPRFRISETLLERMLYLLELHCGKEDRIITVKEAEDLFVEHLKLYRPSAAERKHIAPHNMHTANAVSIVYKYWMDQRNKLQKPLLRRFWTPTSIENQNPHMVFRPREKERYRLRKNRRNDADALIKSEHMLDNLEKAERVLTYVRKRELVKRHLLAIRRETFLQKVSSIIDPPEKQRLSKLQELTADLNYILSGKNSEVGDDAGILGVDNPGAESLPMVAPAVASSSARVQKDGAAGSGNSGGHSNKRSLSEVGASPSQGALKQMRLEESRSAPLSWGGLVSHSAHRTYRDGNGNMHKRSGRPYVKFAEQVYQIGGMSGRLLRHINQSQRHSVAAAVFGLGEFMSDREATQVAMQGGQVDKREQSDGGSSIGSRSELHSALSSGSNFRTNPSSSLSPSSGADAEGHIHMSGSEAGGLVSPMKKPRAANIPAHQKKTTELSGFTRTADDKIICDRLQDMPGFVPSFLLDIEQTEESPMVRQTMHGLTLPGQFGGTGSATDIVADSEKSLLAVQQQLLHHHRPPSAPVLPTFPPQRWAVTNINGPTFGRTECKTGENSRVLRKIMGVKNVSHDEKAKSYFTSTSFRTCGGSRGLWRRQKPPVRYFARGRIGRNGRIWMDRSVSLDLSKTETGADLDAEASLGVARESNRIMDREFLFGYSDGSGAGGPPPSIPEVVTGSALWSFHKRSSEPHDEHNDLAPGTSTGGRKHIYAAPHPLNSGNNFLDVARSVAEQVPGMTSSMKHLNPKSYLACEEIISTQPIISAASSAAGTAKSR